MTDAAGGRALTRRGFFFGAAACAFATVLPHEASAEPAIGRLLGVFRFAGGNAERRAVSRAIERAVSGVGFLFRGVARDRLRFANPIPEKLVLAADEEMLSLAYKGERFTAPLDGSTVRVKSRAGQAMSLHLVRGSSSVDQIFSSAAGTRTNRFTPTADGIVVDVTIRAEQLPRPMAYRLTYRR